MTFNAVRRLLAALVLTAIAASPAAAQLRPNAPNAPTVGLRPNAATALRRDENVLYTQGQRALNNGRWEIALDTFTRLAALNGTRRDAALYWTAYAQNRLGRQREAIQTIDELLRVYPNSTFAPQARALDVEVRRDAGQTVRPNAQEDDMLRIIALQSMLQSDPDMAIPQLDRVLQSTAVPRVKSRVLFLLASSDRPQAREILADAARGQKSPDLQGPALGYLAAQHTAESQQLIIGIYEQGDVMTKRQVIRALVQGNDAETLVAIARGENNPMRKRDLVQALGQFRNNRVAFEYLQELAR